MAHLEHSQEAKSSYCFVRRGSFRRAHTLPDVAENSCLVERITPAWSWWLDYVEVAYGD